MYEESYSLGQKPKEVTQDSEDERLNVLHSLCYLSLSR